jgi:hypothetical protein
MIVFFCPQFSTLKAQRDDYWLPGLFVDDPETVLTGLRYHCSIAAYLLHVTFLSVFL